MTSITPRPSTTDGKLLLTVEEVANLTSLGRSTVYELLARGEIPSITIGRSRRVPSEALHAWIRREMATSLSTALGGGVLTK
jgi:excisionase family DNA binding protein